jgi:hypothetical protein
MMENFDGLPPKEFYAASNLKTNPFRQNPLLDTDPRAGIWVGYQAERKELLRAINQCRSDYIGNSSLLLLYGELGAGKTHALMWARHQILVEQKANFDAVAYSIGSLRNDDKITFAATFERDIVNKSSIVNDVVEFRQHLDELCVEYRKAHAQASLSKDETLEKMIPSRELSTLAKEIIHAETPEAVRKVLVPGKLGEFGTVGKFAALVNLFVMDIDIKGEAKSWKKAAYLFIDELNLLVEASAKEQRMANEMIRNLYDSCPNRFGFVLASTSSVANVSLLFDEWVISRVSKQIVLQTLPQQEAKDFVAGILNHERVSNPESDPFRPFTESAVDSIVAQMSAITPRRIMKTMERVLELVRTEGHDPKNDGLVTSQFLDDHGITDEVNAIPL